MKASIINIGDELLIGQVVNTNAAYMSRALTAAGIAVAEVCTVADDSEAIESAVRRCMDMSDAVLVTGGLGPTKDDITKTTLCHIFGSELYENAEALANIERLFAQRGYPMTETNRRQAWVPRCCRMINNDLGTAPCMWFERETDRKSDPTNHNSLITNHHKILVSLPGVPFEMEWLMDRKVVPMLREEFRLGAIIYKNIVMQGIGESFLSDRLEGVEAALPENVRLAYLPQAGMIKLRLTANGNDRQSLQQAIDEAAQKIGDAAGEFIVGEDAESIPEIVAERMKRHGFTLSAAESCTGGKIASLLTAMPGASDYFKGGVVSYCDEVKRQTLGVSQATLDSFSAVSEQTVREMAEEVRERLGTDYAVATTGVAGPTGGTAECPVGTVWMAVATPTQTITKRMHYGSRRQQVIDRAVNEVLAMLARLIPVD